LAAGLRPDSLGELERSPRPLAAIGEGVQLLRWMEGRGGEGRRKGWEFGKGRNRKGGIASSLFNFWLRACNND